MKTLLEENRNYVDRHLERYLENDQPLLDTLFESVNYTLFSGGKRIRPLFCFLSGELFGVSRDRLVSLACALEMIHTASLIMDDLPHMDGAELRRGKAANHLVYGQDVAALASIGLLLRAYEVVFEDPQLSDSLKTGIVHHLAGAVGIGGMVGGQFADLYFSGSGSKETALDFIHRRKTASLFVASGVTAAMVGDASAEQIAALDIFARNFGVCFQILDDLSDRQDGGDGAESANYVTVHGVEKAEQTARDSLHRALAALEIFAGKNEKLLALCTLLQHNR
jgi:geranylgeranyl diphosphate synthase type II